MKTVAEVNAWWDKLEREGALYVWGMNGEEITKSNILKAYGAYGSSSGTYTMEYYMDKLQEGQGRIGADCSGAFCPLAGSDNTAAGYYSGCSEKGKINTLPKDKACMVFKRNSKGAIYHIGWYRPEDGTVSEMASSAVNFRRKPLLGAGWSDWGIPRFIDYQKAEEGHKSGWQQEDGGWRFYLGDTGECVRNDWYKDGEKWYWFDGAGMMVTNTWYRYKGDWYWLGSDGAMVKGQLMEQSGKWYYLDETGAMAGKPVTLTPDEDGALRFVGLVE